MGQFQYLTYINTCLMFTDDIANCADTWIRLQKQLNIISEFCQLTKMTVNLNKTEIIVFRNGGPLRSYESWTFNGIPVKTTSEYKYLGFIFTPKLSWSKAKRKVALHARKAIFCIKTYQRKFGYFQQDEIFRLFFLWLNRSSAMGLRSGALNIQTL